MNRDMNRRNFLSSGSLAAFASVLGTGATSEAITIGDRLGFEYADDVDRQLGFFRDKPTRPSMLQDFELGREPELGGSILAVEAIAQALDVRAPRIEMVATLLRMKAASFRRSV